MFPSTFGLGGAPPFGLGGDATGPPSSVPEPGVPLLLLTGLGGLALAGRKRT